MGEPLKIAAVRNGNECLEIPMMTADHSIRKPLKIAFVARTGEIAAARSREECLEVPTTVKPLLETTGLSEAFYRLSRSDARTFLELLREDYRHRQTRAEDDGKEASRKVWKP